MQKDSPRLTEANETCSDTVETKFVASLQTPDGMRRVDWRWAVAKGYMNKETNEWNEAMGGMDAYLKQRNERIVSRFVFSDCRFRSLPSQTASVAGDPNHG